MFAVFRRLLGVGARLTADRTFSGHIYLQKGIPYNHVKKAVV